MGIDSFSHAHTGAVESGGNLSGRLFGNGDRDFSPLATGSGLDRSITSAAGDSLVMSSPYAALDTGAAPQSPEPMLSADIREYVKNADSLNLSTSSENAAQGKTPDYRVVEENGQFVLEKVADGDPLADGELNIEMDAGDKSLKEALSAKDKSLKEYYRELIQAFQKDHPGKEAPGWWTDIINSEPYIPQNTQPVSVRPPRPAPQSERQQPQSMPRASSGGGGGGGGGMPSFGGRGRGGGDGQGFGFEPGGKYRGEGPDRSRGSSGATPSADQETVLNNVKTVMEVAEEKGVDKTLAVAMMLVESGGDNRAEGDGGTSFGLFQLHKGGMLTEAGLTKEQAFDPRTNAEVSLSHLAKIDDRYSDPGKAAAASQRPADPVGYANKVNASMDEARELIAMVENGGSPLVAKNSHDSQPVKRANA